MEARQGRGSEDADVADAAPLAPVLRTRGLSVSYRGTPALRGIDLDIRPGEIVALVGESGSGKSTLGLAIQGLLPEGSGPLVTGSAEVAGREVVGAPDPVLREVRRRHLGAIFQDPLTSLNPSMRIEAQLAEVAPEGADLAAMLDAVDIREPEARLRAFPHELSGGQRQRVMIAMALAADPELVIADEPTTALDVTVQARILDTIRALRDRTGAAFLFVTHDLAVAAAVADRICVLYAGVVMETGLTADVLRSPAHPYTAALLAARFTIGVARDRRLPTLPGEPPSPERSFDSCAFAPRCTLAAEVCMEGEPALVDVPHHDGLAACRRVEHVTSDLWDQDTERSTGGSIGPETLVRLTGVWKRYGKSSLLPWSRKTGIPALQGVDLTVASGESVALVGESGSGKSTLLRIIAGLVEPDQGEVEFHGDSPPQMVYQDASLSLTPWLTVEQLVGERLRPSIPSRSERREAVAAALARVGLGEDLMDAMPGQLSGGQRQRVAIARAIVVPPSVLLCDEPVSALDVSLAASIMNLLRELPAQLGMPLIMVTHDLAAARFMADRIVVMQEGLVVEEGEACAVVENPQHPYTQTLLASMPAAKSAAGGA